MEIKELTSVTSNFPLGAQGSTPDERANYCVKTGTIATAGGYQNLASIC